MSQKKLCFFRNSAIMEENALLFFRKILRGGNGAPSDFPLFLPSTCSAPRNAHHHKGDPTHEIRNRLMRRHGGCALPRAGWPHADGSGPQADDGPSRLAGGSRHGPHRAGGNVPRQRRGQPHRDGI